LTNEKNDVVLDLKAKKSDLYNLLDPSIRLHIQKRGISVKENVYIGFDTEFTKKDLKNNDLISSQLAVSTQTYVQIPKVTSYQISMLDENNDLVKEKKNSSIFNYRKVEASIQMCISKIRQLKYERHDGCMLILMEGLKMIKGLNYFEHEDKIVYSLPRSLIQPYIHFGDTFSFKEILQVSSGIAKAQLRVISLKLMKLMKEISSNNFTILEGRARLDEALYTKYKAYSEIADLNTDYNQSLPILYQPLSEDLDEKRLTRKYVTDLFPQKVSVTKSRNYYIIAHLTPADLSLMKDFNEIKEDLSIVNGSFVTLGKPIKYCGRNIHIRDTMLLAPGGSKSLATIGKLYGEAFNKLPISKEDLEDMQGFLVRDKSKFTAYALRDSLISLIHAA